MVTLEPGLRLSGARGLLPVCLTDSAGAPLPLAVQDLRLEVAGRTARDVMLVSLAPPPAGEGSALAVLFDAPPRDDSGVSAWSEALLSFARGSAPGAPRALFAGGERLRVLMPLGTAPPARADIEAALAARTPASLWDRVLDALDVLSGPAARKSPARRVLVVVATGDEGRPSLHPVQTCVDAAVAARVAVYCLALVGSRDGTVTDAGGAGAARLRQLAAGSGGRAFAASGIGTTASTGQGSVAGALAARPGVEGVEAELAAWHRLLEVVESVPAVSFSVDRLTLPAVLTARLVGTPEAAAEGSLRARASVRRHGLGFWPALGLAVLTAGAAVTVVLRQRGSSCGELVQTQAGKQLVHRLRGSAASVGTSPLSTVVVDDRRVSREHAVIARRAGKIVLTDLRSTNGTCVNGQPVRTAILQDGDRILFGGAVEFVYRRGPGPRRRGR